MFRLLRLQACARELNAAEPKNAARQAHRLPPPTPAPPSASPRVVALHQHFGCANEVGWMARSPRPLPMRKDGSRHKATQVAPAPTRKAADIPNHCVAKTTAGPVPPSAMLAKAMNLPTARPRCSGGMDRVAMTPIAGKTSEKPSPVNVAPSTAIADVGAHQISTCPTASKAQTRRCAVVNTSPTCLQHVSNISTTEPVGVPQPALSSTCNRPSRQTNSSSVRP